MNGDELFGKVIVVSGILWIIGFTVFLIVNKKERQEMESIDIFLGYTGGTIAVALFGATLLGLVLVIGTLEILITRMLMVGLGLE